MVPDGLLLRVSSIGEEDQEFNLHLSFIRELMSELGQTAVEAPFCFNSQ